MPRKPRYKVVQKKDHVELHWNDGTIQTVRSELDHHRIMKALRGPGKPYVHERPKK